MDLKNLASNLQLSSVVHLPIPILVPRATYERAAGVATGRHKVCTHTNVELCVAQCVQLDNLVAI